MAGKFSFLVGFGAGYVLGARSGRERYDQIAEKAQEVWQNPRVQQKAGQAQQLVKDKAGDAGSKVAEKAGEAGSKIGDKVSAKVGSGDSDPTSGVAPAPRAGTTGQARR